MVQEPMHTWSILILPISSTVLTLSGLWGQAASGTSLERSMFIFFVVNCVGVCGHRNVVLFSALSLEELRE